MSDFVNVPRDPTEAMMKAADTVDWTNEDERASIINMWQVMLSAAPAPGGGADEEIERLQRELVALAERLEYRGNSIEWIHSKMENYRSALGAAWGALRAAGVLPDGETTVAKAISALATREEALAPCKSCNGSGMDAGSRFNRCPDCSEEAPAEAGE